MTASDVPLSQAFDGHLFARSTGYIPNELQPNQSSGVAGSLGLSVPHDCGAANRLTCADLFCGEGGAAAGIYRAGFNVTGWDIQCGLSYPFPRHIGDALEANLEGFNFVWASPPCQASSTLRHRTGKDYECLIARTREKLIAWGGPWIIENVVGAPLQNSVMICGSAFAMDVRRHRIFESNVTIVGAPCRHELTPEPIDVSGTGGFQTAPRKKRTGGRGRKPRGLEEAQRVMGMPWATRRGISQAIPPAYSEFLARQVYRIIAARADAAGARVLCAA